MTVVAHGLEGVVAFETEIAEPDREGGALRYRGVDIEELVGHYPYEQVWGLLVDDSFQPGLPPAEPFEPSGLTGRRSSAGRRRRSASCSSGGVRPTRRTSRRSTPTGSAPPSTG